jgi:acetyltransferase-like isoleucine patch superfamily enzyme
MIHDGPAIHEKAHVDLKTCSLGDGTFVWQFSSVIRGAVIGQRCVIAACAIVDGARMGDGCLIGHGASLHPGTRLEDDVFVGPGAIFCNDRWPRASKDGFDTDGLKTRATSVVKDGASIGAGCIILPGVVIGPGAMIAAGVICERPVPGGYLLRRDGSLEPVPEDLKDRRMKWAL